MCPFKKDRQRARMKGREGAEERWRKRQIVREKEGEGGVDEIIFWAWMNQLFCQCRERTRESSALN